jgi:hypothetical protein
MNLATASNRMAPTTLNRMAPIALNRMAPTALNQMAPIALNENHVYDLCKIARFPYESNDPTKLTHMSCFFYIICYLRPKLGLKGLIWSLRPTFNLQGLIDSTQHWLVPLSSPRFQVSTSFFTFDRRRLRGYCGVSNGNRAQKPNPLYIWA